MDKNKSLALDDEDLRRINSQKVVDGIDKLGEGMKEAGSYISQMKKYHKINLYIAIGTGAIFLLFLGGALAISLSNGGLDSLYDSGAVQRRFQCPNGDIVRTYQDVNYYKIVYNETCNYYKRGG